MEEKFFSDHCLYTIHNFINPLVICFPNNPPPQTFLKGKILQALNPLGCPLLYFFQLCDVLLEIWRAELHTIFQMRLHYKSTGAL